VTTIAVVFHSATGRTEALARAVARGAQQVAGTTVEVMPVERASPDVLAAADAIVFGCPTYMGSASAAFKAFMDSTSTVWGLQGWRDKLAAGFTHSAAPSGDKLGTLVQLAVFAAQHGMVWIGLGLPPTYAAGVVEETNRLGSHLGAMAQSPPGRALSDGDVRTAEFLGGRVAGAAARWGRAARALGAVGASARHPTTAHWVFPPRDRAPLAHGLERVNLRELVARPERFEHHLVVCASIAGTQLEVTAASEPLYFGHVNISDEYALALPTGDDLVDRFPLRTFVSDPASGNDVARYNHRAGDLVLHPVGYLHWPGRLRPPYEPFAVPRGMRRTGLSLVYCASAPTPSARCTVPLAPDRAGDVKAYVPSPPHLVLTALREPGVVAAIGATTLAVVVEPARIAPPRGGFVFVLDGGGDFTACDLVRIPDGGQLDATGIGRALVFAAADAPPDPAPPAWRESPPPPFAPYEDAPPGALPIEHGDVRVAAVSPQLVSIAIGAHASEVPRYWLARMLFRVALHGLRLGHVETYGGFAIDDRAGLTADVAFSVRGAGTTLPRADALALVERLYRAVAPPDYTERLA
jgi:NAD(P)H dehydrogenase (quinone)